MLQLQRGAVTCQCLRPCPFWIFFHPSRPLTCIPGSSPRVQQDGFGFTSWLLFAFVLLIDFASTEPAPSVSGFWTSPHCTCQSLCLGFLLGLVATVAFGFSMSARFSFDRTHQSAFSWTYPSVPQRISSPRKWLMPFVALIAVFHAVPCHAMPLAPAGSEEQSRAARRAGNVLVADRVVLHQTRTRRETLLAAFDNWLASNWRTTLEALMNGPGFRKILWRVQ